MKIAYIAIRGIPLSDGIVQYTDDIARKMVERGNEVTVYASKRYGNKTGIYDGSYYIKTVPSLPFGFAEKMSLVFMASIHQLFHKYDVVHYHAMGPSIFAFMGRLSGKATVIQSHGIEYNRAKFSRLAKFVLKVLEKLSINLGDELLVCSDALHEHFIKKYKKETIVIHNGVNIPVSLEPDQEILKEYGINKGSYYLYIARITEEKGLEYLIHAFKQLNTDKKLIIAGPFDDKNNIFHKKLKQMAITDRRISFIGFASGKKKESLLQGAYAYCLPSESEGFSIALLEAMSYGKCCIVSDIPSNLEAAGNCCLSFKSKDEKSLYEELVKAEQDPQMVYCLGEEARNRISVKFNENDLATKTEILYREVCRRKQRKRRRGNEETRRIQKKIDNASNFNNVLRKKN